MTSVSFSVELRGHELKITISRFNAGGERLVNVTSQCQVRDMASKGCLVFIPSCLSPTEDEFVNQN